MDNVFIEEEVYPWLKGMGKSTEAKRSRDYKMASLNSPLSRKAFYKPKGPWSTFGFRETLKKVKFDNAIGILFQ